MGLPRLFQQLLPLHERRPRPRPGEWMAEHKEPNQSMGKFKACCLHPRSGQKLYIVPLGPFDPAHQRILLLLSEWMEAYFGIPVVVEAGLPLNLVPGSARRKSWPAAEQLLTTFILERLLAKTIPRDAAARVAVTTMDLYPGSGWNFVFGEADLDRHVGVWSMYRDGDPSAGDEAFQLCLRRAMKTSTHETAHLFRLEHCQKYLCNMAGSNSTEESDGLPVWLCPHCLHKLCFATRVQVGPRFQALVEFCERNELETEWRFFQASLESLTKRKAGPKGRGARLKEHGDVD
eukprot:RCo042231